MHQAWGLRVRSHAGRMIDTITCNKYCLCVATVGDDSAVTVPLKTEIVLSACTS